MHFLLLLLFLILSTYAKNIHEVVTYCRSLPTDHVHTKTCHRIMYWVKISTGDAIMNLSVVKSVENQEKLSRDHCFEKIGSVTTVYAGCQGVKVYDPEATSYQCVSAIHNQLNQGARMGDQLLERKVQQWVQEVLVAQYCSRGKDCSVYYSTLRPENTWTRFWVWYAIANDNDWSYDPFSENYLPDRDVIMEKMALFVNHSACRI